MGIGAKLSELIKLKNTNVSELANRAKVPASTLYSIIKRDNSKADIDVLIAIAKVLGVSVEYFSGDSYYLNPETAKLAQEAYDDPDVRILLDAKRDLSPDDLRFVIDLVKKLKKDDKNDQDDTL